MILPRCFYLVWTRQLSSSCSLTATIFAILCFLVVRTNAVDYDLSNLPNAKGFTMRWRGRSANAAGDVNGDGIDDVLVGASWAGYGEAYVVFGRKDDLIADMDLQSFSTGMATGFRILGTAEDDRLGISVSTAGDINCDGVDDIIVGARNAEPEVARVNSGIAYVIFGRKVTSVGNAFADIHLTAAAMATGVGFRILGPAPNTYNGHSVSAVGDVNGDGIDDIITGAFEADPPILGTEWHAGISYVIFGRNITNNDTAFGDIDLATFSNYSEVGFRIIGAMIGEKSGTSVSGAGDVNGDGINDLIIGAPFADTPTIANIGISYVIFGRKVASTAGGNAFGDIQLPTTAMNTSIGFRILGAAAQDRSGFSVRSAGDVNGDSVDDVIIGANMADVPGLAPGNNAGISYVIFGRNVAGGATVFTDVMLSSVQSGSSIGFRILGAVADDESGYSVSGAGDINNDGTSDVIVGAWKASPDASRIGAGISYVLFGRKSIAGAIVFNDVDLATDLVSPLVGFRILGLGVGDYSGYSVNAAGDINGDLVDDIVISTEMASSFVIYGVSTRPSSLPSSQPSGQPSQQPVVFPTAIPSSQPTRQPTAQPVLYPSSSPTAQPSRQPSSQPNVLPSSVPSTQPSVQPSSLPSGQPSSEPSNQPFVRPTSLPTTQPTMQPSAQPAGEPSTQPTSVPTSQPSMQPSEQPTGVPSSQPISQPTSQPSVQPISAPTGHPSVRPSSLPTSQPSCAPSSQPMAQPSSQPSSQPSEQPSNEPSSFPSAQPSSKPSTQPSLRPTASPSAQPSSNPSAMPTAQLSANPSAQPSTRPSTQPSTQPTFQPSLQPITQPSLQPSTQPSTTPSMQPSSQPSAGPSRQPSAQPSTQPIIQPSLHPSTQPTTQPSVQPSGQLSAPPSGQPSALPTLQPSLQPSTQPSTQPSLQPYNRPSSQPSSHPSAQPSVQPVALPSTQPTSMPTIGPSAQPSWQPSARPSVQPLVAPSMQPSSQPSIVPSVQPSAAPTWEITSAPSSAPSCSPSSRPSTQPSSQPSMQPSQQPMASPSAQPSLQPTTQPSTQPSIQPQSTPSSQPTSLPTVSPSTDRFDGMWSSVISKMVNWNAVVLVNESVWACGEKYAGSFCSVLNKVAGSFEADLSFNWTQITTVLQTSDSDTIIVSGQSLFKEFSSEGHIASCRFKTNILVCSVFSFHDVNFKAGAYVPYSRKLVYIGTSEIFTAATIINFSTGVHNSYTYAYTALESISLLYLHSPPSYVGAFVVGTGVSFSGAMNYIVAGIVRTDSGSLTAMYIAPTSGSILNNVELVNAMALEYEHPDTFIAGGLELSDGAGMHAYVMRVNAFFGSVNYVICYRTTNTSTRRMLGDALERKRSVARGLVRVDATLFLIVDLLNSGNNSTASTTLLKVDSQTGLLLQQVHLFSLNATSSLSCNRITIDRSGLFLYMACQVRDPAGTSSVLISTSTELQAFVLPAGISTMAGSLFKAQAVPFVAKRFTVTATKADIAARQSELSIGDMMPTVRPSMAPTLLPSSQPSSAPSDQPSGSPTATPSVSLQPSSEPSSSRPTNTYKPTAKPTSRPSIKPTIQPTVSPSLVPTTSPTARPTNRPSIHPSGRPSVTPTAVPTMLPTSIVTKHPTIKPSQGSSEKPTLEEPEVGSAIIVGKKENKADDAVYIFLYSLASVAGFWCLYQFLKCCVYASEERKKRQLWRAELNTINVALAGQAAQHFQPQPLLPPQPLQLDTAAFDASVTISLPVAAGGAYVNSSPQQSRCSSQSSSSVELSSLHSSDGSENYLLEYGSGSTAVSAPNEVSPNFVGSDDSHSSLSAEPDSLESAMEEGRTSFGNYCDHDFGGSVDSKETSEGTEGSDRIVVLVDNGEAETCSLESGSECDAAVQQDEVSIEQKSLSSREMTQITANDCMRDEALERNAISEDGDNHPGLASDSTQYFYGNGDDGNCAHDSVPGEEAEYFSDVDDVGNYSQIQGDPDYFSEVNNERNYANDQVYDETEYFSDDSYEANYASDQVLHRDTEYVHENTYEGNHNRIRDFADYDGFDQGQYFNDQEYHGDTDYFGD